MKLQKGLTISLLLLSSVALMGCGNTQEKYNKVSEYCTMTGHSLYQWHSGGYSCYTEERIRTIRFGLCSEYCELAIDDNRDLTLTNSSTETLGCLELCMGD